MSTDLIGAGETFTTVADWFSNIPGTLTENERGECKNETFTVTAQIVLFGKTQGAFTIKLTTASGASFADDDTNALKIDSANGALIRTVSNISGQMMDLNQAAMIVERLMLEGAHTATEPLLVQFNGTNEGLNDCIVQGLATKWVIKLDNGAARNVLAIDRHSSGAIGCYDFQFGGEAYNCGAIRPSSFAGGGTGMEELGGSDNKLFSCYSFGLLLVMIRLGTLIQLIMLRIKLTVLGLIHKIA